MKTILIIAVCLLTHPAFSCSCETLSLLDKQTVSELKGAYHGKIVALSEDTKTFVTHYKLLVKHTYVGTKADTVEFTSAADGGLCGIIASIGDEWIITWETNEAVPQLWICSRIYDFAGLRQTKQYFRFRFGNGVHKMIRKKAHSFRHDRRMLRRFGQT